MHGFINYYYKDGSKPGNTKPYFKEYKILTIHSIISLNALLLVEKTRKFRDLLPNEVLMSIDDNSPSYLSTQDSCVGWLSKYNTNIFRNSVFFKGPMLSTRAEFNNLLDFTSDYSLQLYKRKLKSSIMALQTSGTDNEWDPENFLTHNIPGLRKSERNTNKH